MITAIILTCLLGFLFFYLTSRRAVIEYRTNLIDWIGTHPVKAKFTAFGWIVLSIALSILHWGFLGGIFSFVVILMTVASLILLLQPLRVFEPATLVVLFVFLGLLEMII